MARGKRRALINASTAVDLRLQYQGGLQFKKALLNGVKLAFSGGIARFSVVADVEHQLVWEVVGFVGTRWSYKLTIDSEGYVVDPKKLSDPGKSFELERPSERRPQRFTVTHAEE